MHRSSLSIRSKRDPGGGRLKFGMGAFQGLQQPEMSRKMGRLIKTEGDAIGAYEVAGRERISVASQLSEWGESTEDDAVSDISDKLGVLLAELGEQEDVYAQNMEDHRALLKQIRNIEASVQPTREGRAKVADEIQKLKLRDPTSAKLETLEQELVRAEAHNLVAEAQLTNVTRQKMKEAYDIHLAAVIEKGEKQILLARHAKRLLNYLDDSPVVPGDQRAAYEHTDDTKHILEEAENNLRTWERTDEPVHTSAGETSTNLLPTNPGRTESANGVADGSDGAESVKAVNGLEKPNVPHASGAIDTQQPVAVPY